MKSDLKMWIILPVVMISILVGWAIGRMGLNSGFNVRGASYSFENRGKYISVSRNDKKIFNIAEIGSDRISVEVFNESENILTFGAKLLPVNGLTDLRFVTPKDESNDSRASYQWIGSSYAADESTVGVKRFERP